MVISKTEKSILAKYKVYCPDVQRLEYRYFVYSRYYDEKNIYRERLVNEDGVHFAFASLRKAKRMHLLNSI